MATDSRAVIIAIRRNVFIVIMIGLGWVLGHNSGFGLGMNSAIFYISFYLSIPRP